jgi:hypothetical protein
MARILLKSHEGVSKMRQIIRDYLPITDIFNSKHTAIGDSASPKDLIFHVFNDNSQLINVLDIGFGTGRLGHRDLLPTSRTKVMEQSPLISENSGYETIQIYR